MDRTILKRLGCACMCRPCPLRNIQVSVECYSAIRTTTAAGLVRPMMEPPECASVAKLRRRGTRFYANTAATIFARKQSIKPRFGARRADLMTCTPVMFDAKTGATTMIACTLSEWSPQCQFWNEKRQHECTRTKANGEKLYCRYHANRNRAH